MSNSPMAPQGMFVLRVLAVAIAYYGTGRIGLLFPYAGDVVTLLWPPTGIAVATLVLGGLKYWPAALLGAIAVNSGTNVPTPAVLGIAVGNTLGPVFGAYLLRNVFRFDHSFSHQRDLVAFVFGGSLIAMLIPAACGVFCLWAVGSIPGSNVLSTGAVWYLGDSMGVLLAAPPILVAPHWRESWTRLRANVAETTLAFSALAALALVVFLETFPFAQRDVVLAFLPFPVLLWIALRTDVLTASLANFALAGVAVVGTAISVGPFVREDVHTGLVLLWVYLGTVTIMTLLVNALRSERRAAESNVLRAKLELESIFRALPDLYFRMTADSTIVDYRAADLRDLYVVPGHFVGRRMTEVLPADVARRVEDAVARALDGQEVVELEYRLDLDRGPADFEARFVSLPERQVLAIVRNITDRRRVAVRLERSEARFRAFMDNGPTISLVKDAQFRYVYANRRWEDQFHPSRTDWLGKTDDAFWPEETARLFQQSDREVLETRRPIERVETAPAPSGEIRHWFIFKFPLDDPDGQPLIGGCVLDVSQSRRVEEQLRQSQKMEAVGQLAGGVAHDFNNLLTIINGYTALMMNGLNESHPWHGFLKDILRSGERAAELTQQLLAFSRKQILQPRIIDLNAVISQNAKMLCRLLGDDIDLALHCDEHISPVKVDPGQLEQAIVNLAVNARDAMPDGGVLTITTRMLHPGDPAAELPSGSVVKPHVVLSVADTGAGMSDETRVRIFEPFFTTKGIGKGTGLGLSMVYGFVQQSDGQIVVESEIGKGTRFDIRLPASLESVPHGDVPADPPPLPVGTETILLVEDEASVRDLTRKILERCGYTVLVAHHGKHALEVVDGYSGKIDMLVTDVQMPQMNGRLLADHLIGQRPGLKVLFMSGYADSMLNEHSGNPVSYSLIEKPFAPVALAQRVRKILDRPIAQ